MAVLLLVVLAQSSVELVPRPKDEPPPLFRPDPPLPPSAPPPPAAHVDPAPNPMRERTARGSAPGSWGYAQSGLTFGAGTFDG